MSDKKHYVITFGDNMLPGISYYTTIYTLDQGEARSIMNGITNRWAFIYDSEDKAGVEKYNLQRVDLREIQRMVEVAKLYQN